MLPFRSWILIILLQTATAVLAVFIFLVVMVIFGESDLADAFRIVGSALLPQTLSAWTTLMSYWQYHDQRRLLKAALWGIAFSTVISFAGVATHSTMRCFLFMFAGYVVCAIICASGISSPRSPDSPQSDASRRTGG